MARLPLQIGPLHFIGIGGIGMSGIAEVMHNLGYKIQGSDASDSANVKRLRGLGIKIAIGHSAENLGNAAVVVYSSAVKADNPELSAARAHQTPTVKRAEMLAELMRLKSAVAIAGTRTFRRVGDAIDVGTSSRSIAPDVNTTVMPPMSKCAPVTRTSSPSRMAGSRSETSGRRFATVGNGAAMAVGPRSSRPRCSTG